jgi:hypothetical protein
VVAWRIAETESPPGPAAREVTTTSEDTAPVPSATASEAPAKRGVLEITADAPIAQLELDARNILIPQAVKKLEVPLGDAVPEKLVALTEDGRRVEIALSPELRRIELDFPDAAAPASSPRRPVPRPPAPSPAPPPDDGLAESPYGAK